jgi:homocysteine S-methyltransferase
MLIKDYLKNHRLVTDGSMGTYYSSLTGQAGAISELANVSDPDTIMRIHKDYIKAGARLLRTNTFAANRAILKVQPDEQKQLLQKACLLAKQAVKETEDRGSGDNPIWIFGDIGPVFQNADSKEEELLEEYRLICDIFLEEGLSGIHFETFSSLHYIEKLIPYIREKNNDIFILVSFSVNKNGYTGAGIRAERILDRVSQIEGIDACGLNCGIGSGHMFRILNNIKLPVNKFIFAAPNAGYPEHMQNRMIFMDNAEYFTDNMKRIVGLGIDMIGGCCGTTPDYILGLTKAIDVTQKVSVRRQLEPEQEVGQQTVKNNELMSLFMDKKKVIAVELDPPYDADIDSVMECAHSLKHCGADLITFADSPLGRSRVDSILMSIKIAEETGLKVMPHVCCRDRNMISMRSTLLGAYIHGIRNLLLVTGDPVPGDNRTSTTAVFDYNSIQLMDFVKEMNIEHFAKEPFCYGGALNHGRGNLDKIIERMQRKLEAGASFFLTQPIYSKEDVQRIKLIKEKVDTKILCGIMPLVSYRNACFIKNEFTGIHVPDEIVNRYRPDMTREEAELVGAAVAREVMELLEPVADGYYFMLPFNRVSLMGKILNK